MADSSMGKRSLVSGSEYKDIGKSKGAGGGKAGKLDNAQKIKAGASIFAIVVAVFFMAYYFGLFGEAAPDPGTLVPIEQTLTAEQIEEIEEIELEQQEMIEDGEIQSAGS